MVGCIGHVMRGIVLLLLLVVGFHNAHGVSPAVAGLVVLVARECWIYAIGPIDARAPAPVALYVFAYGVLLGEAIIWATLLTWAFSTTELA